MIRPTLNEAVVVLEGSRLGAASDVSDWSCERGCRDYSQVQCRGVPWLM